MLPSLRSTADAHGLTAKKSLGQHFLFDSNITDKIVRLAGRLENQPVIEIGPGPGGLTRSLLRVSPSSLLVIEKDTDCLPILEQLSAVAPDVLRVVHEDALKVDMQALMKVHDVQPPVHIVANLPYNIGTELIVKWLEQPSLYSTITVMLQKEVVDRIVAKPHTKDYGRLAVLCQWLCDVEVVMDVPPEAFSPPPKVMSSVVQLRPLAAPRYPADQAVLQKLCQAVFSQRRKMLRRSMKMLTDAPEELLAEAAIDPTLRPEALSVENLCRLAQALKNHDSP